MTKIVDMVETIRGLREQVKDRNSRLAANPHAKELVAVGKELIAGLNAVEEEIHNPHAEVNYDVLAGRRGGAMLYSRLSWLFITARTHDGPPTQGMQEVAAELVRELVAQETALDALLSVDLAKLNAAAKEKDVPYVLTP